MKMVYATNINNNFKKSNSVNNSWSEFIIVSFNKKYPEKKSLLQR